MQLTDYVAQVVINIPLILAEFACLIVVALRRGLPRGAKWLAGLGCAAILLTELAWMAWGLSASWVMNWVMKATGIAPGSLDLIFYAVNITLNIFTAIGICLLVAALWTAARQSAAAPASPNVPSTGSPLAPASAPPIPSTAASAYPAPASTPPSIASAYPPAPSGPAATHPSAVGADHNR